MIKNGLEIRMEICRGDLALPLSCSKPGTIILTGLSPSFCWFAKSLSALIKLSHIPYGVTCARNTLAFRWSVLSCMTLWSVPSRCAGLRAPPVAVLLSVPRRDPPDAVFKRETSTRKTHVRQCDSSYSVTWCDDPPQDAPTLTHNILRHAYMAFVFKFNFSEAFLLLSHWPIY